MSQGIYTAGSLPTVLAAVLGTGRRVVAPVERDGLLRFAETTDAAAVRLDGQTRFSAKEVVFPRSERLFGFRFGNADVELLPGDAPPPPTVLFGVRPCDAAGLAILDQVFSGEPADGPYLARRERITVVGLACAEAEPHCACTAVGLSPVSGEGCDLLLTPLDGQVLVEVLSDRGQELAGLLGATLSPADEALLAAKAELGERTAEQITPRHLPADLSGAFAQALAAAFTSDEWVAAARRCVGCGTCAFVCPTCHCFDVVDESNLRGGERRRNWDACQFGLFTLHASGHNPRADQAARYRQRALHKFSYYPAKHGKPMCVGCGRCLAVCPVGMDIFEIAVAAATATAAG